MTSFSLPAAPTSAPGKAFGNAVVLWEDFTNAVVDSAATAVDLLGWAVLPAGASAATSGHAGECVVTYNTSETWIQPDCLCLATAVNRSIYVETRIKYSALTARLRWGVNTAAVPSGNTAKAIFDFSTTGVIAAIVYDGATYSQAAVATAAVDTYYTLGIHIKGTEKTIFYFNGNKVATINHVPTAGTAIAPIASVAAAGNMTIDYIGVLADRE